MRSRPWANAFNVSASLAPAGSQKCRSSASRLIEHCTDWLRAEITKRRSFPSAKADVAGGKDGVNNLCASSVRACRQQIIKCVVSHSAEYSRYHAREGASRCPPAAYSAAYRVGIPVIMARWELHNPFCWGPTSHLDSASQAAAKKDSEETRCDVRCARLPIVTETSPSLHALLLAVPASAPQSRPAHLQ